MPRKIGSHADSNGIQETWWEDGEGNITIERSQDTQSALDLVAAVNAEGAPTHDGLGKPVGEMPQVVWIDWCLQRGLDWEKLYDGREMDTEFLRCLREHNKFAYRNAKSVHTVQ